MTQRRARPGYCYDPCQGCGETPEYQRLKGTLCTSCRTLLDTAIITKRDQEKRGESVQIRVPQRPSDMPYLDEFDDRSFEDRNPFTKAFHALLMAASEKAAVDDRWLVPDESLFNDKSYDAMRRSYEARVMPQAVIEAARRMHEEAKAMTQRAHEDGKRRGQSLLAQLARGEITADDFNKNAARLKDD